MLAYFTVHRFVFIGVYLFSTAYMLLYCERGEVDLMELKPNP